MKYRLSYLIIILCLFSNSFGQQKELDFELEIEKWKRELFLNKEVGPPCYKDYHQWMEDNPDFYYGLQPITISQYDFNKDDITDALVFFEAVNCVGGNGWGSDFAMLIYSFDGYGLTDKKITQTIEKEIEKVFFERRIRNISHIFVLYDDLSNTVNGRYVAYTSEDPSCCATYKGTFKFQPLHKKIEVKVKIQ